MAGATPHPGHPRTCPPVSGRGQSNSHIIALLSLKILLLAFFILLNALSSFEEERSTAVVESVREAFHGLVEAEYSASPTPAGTGVLAGSEDAFQALKQLFTSNLELVESTDASGALTLQVDLDTADLFAEQGAAFRPDGAEVLRVVAGVLSAPALAGSYQVDVLYGLAGSPGGQDGSRAAVLRAGALVRQLQELGLPAQHLSAGLMPGLEGRVRLHFTIEPETVPAMPEGSRP